MTEKSLENAVAVVGDKRKVNADKVGKGTWGEERKRKMKTRRKKKIHSQQYSLTWKKALKWEWQFLVILFIEDFMGMEKRTKFRNSSGNFEGRQVK